MPAVAPSILFELLFVTVIVAAVLPVDALNDFVEEDGFAQPALSPLTVNDASSNVALVVTSKFGIVKEVGEVSSVLTLVEGESVLYTSHSLKANPLDGVAVIVTIAPHLMRAPVDIASPPTVAAISPFVAERVST